MKHRYMIGSALAVGALVTSAVPAPAVSIVTKSDLKQIEAWVHTCPANAATGASCTKFLIQATWLKTEAGVVTNVVNVEAYNGTKQLDGSVTGPEVASGSVSEQKITVDDKANTARESFTITLTCNSLPCDFGGVYKFSLTLKKSAASVHNANSITVEDSDPTCTSDSSTKFGSTTKASVAGTVKHDGSTKTLRANSGDSSSMGRTQTSNRQVGACT